MFFKKAGGSIFGVSLNKAEQKALDQEIKRQIVEHDHRFDIDKESMILWTLHTEFGFGPQTAETGLGTVLFRKSEVEGILSS